MESKVKSVVKSVVIEKTESTNVQTKAKSTIDLVKLRIEFELRPGVREWPSGYFLGSLNVMYPGPVRHELGAEMPGLHELVVGAIGIFTSGERLQELDSKLEVARLCAGLHEIVSMNSGDPFNRQSVLARELLVRTGE